MAKKRSKRAIKTTIPNSNLVRGTKKTSFKVKFGGFSENSYLGVVNGVVDFDTFQKSLMRRKPYKSFTICRCSPTPKYPRGDWYVEYRYEIPGHPFKYKAVKKRGDLNKIIDPIQRERAAQALQRDLIHWLDLGNMPKWAYRAYYEKKLAEEESLFEQEAAAANWALEKAISEYRKFIKGHGYTPRTLSTYKCYVDDFEEWITDAGLIHTQAKNFMELDLLNILEEVYELLEWSPRTYNNNFQFFNSFFNRCQKLEKQKHDRRVRYDFDIELIDLKITTPQVNKAYSPILQKKIKDELNKPGNENLRDYIEWITLSLMRPKEIRALKVEDIDLDSRQIRIKGKTGDRLIPLSTQLVNLIKKRGYDDLDPGYYLFGRALQPSLERCGINYPLERYAPIKVKLRLGPEYRPYSWKPTGVILMINAGFSDKAIMELTGHKTQDAFSAYKRDLIIENSSVMKGSTVNF